MSKLFQRSWQWLQQPARTHTNADRLGNWIWGISLTYCSWTAADILKTHSDCLLTDADCLHTLMQRAIKQDSATPAKKE